MLRAESNCTVSEVKARPHRCILGSSESGSLRRTQPIDLPAPGWLTMLRRSMIQGQFSSWERMSSGFGASGMRAVWTSASSSRRWNEHDRWRMAPPDCLATTALVQKLRPSRSRWTSNRTGSFTSPDLMK